MEKQKPAGKDITRFPIGWLLIITAMVLILAGYWPNFVFRLRKDFQTA